MIITLTNDGMGVPQAALRMKTPTENDNLLANVYMSLMIRRGSFFADLDFGSRLHLLDRAKNTEQKAALAEEYAEEALQWLLDVKRAQAIAVTAVRDGYDRLKLLVAVTKQSGETVTFDVFTEVV